MKKRKIEGKLTKKATLAEGREEKREMTGEQRKGGEGGHDNSRKKRDDCSRTETYKLRQTIFRI